MAFWYTDIANAQQIGNNYGGQIGLSQIVNPPNLGNISVLEGPPDVIATYVWTGNELANDVIRIALAPAGVCISPNGHVSSGLTGIAPTLTLSIGDNDVGIASNQPVVNQAAVSAGVGLVNSTQAPLWVSGTSYVPGNVVIDANSTPANLTFTCLTATSGSTAPHSAANTTWMPNNQRYANAIDCHAASGNVAFAGGSQLIGLPPISLTPGTAATGYSGGTALFQPYIIQGDCWIEALIATINTTTVNANSVSVFRLTMSAAN